MEETLTEKRLKTNRRKILCGKICELHPNESNNYKDCLCETIVKNPIIHYEIKEELKEEKEKKPHNPVKL